MKHRVENPNKIDRPLDDDEISGGFRKVFLRGKLGEGLYVKVDPDKYEMVIQHLWYIYRDRQTMYAITSIRQPDGKYKQVQMHRMLTNPPPGMVVDHINHDGLDNRLCNLRVCTVSENHLNRGSRKNSSSQYVGVYFHKAAKKWAAEISYRYNKVHLGFFENEKDAALVYDYYARLYKGEYAVLNFPDIHITAEEVEQKRYKPSK